MYWKLIFTERGKPERSAERTNKRNSHIGWRVRVSNPQLQRYIVTISEKFHWKIFFLFYLDVIVKFAFTASGFDVFGNPPGYAPSQTWTIYNKRLEQIKDSAVAYENSYNELQGMIESQKSVEQITSHVTATTQKTVEAEIQRLTDLINGMKAEKKFYVKVR